MPDQGPPCDCSRVPAMFAFDCSLINEAWERGIGGEPTGNGTSPPSAPQAAPLVLPQPFKLEIVQTCELEDPDLRPYVWDCHD